MSWEFSGHGRSGTFGDESRKFKGNFKEKLSFGAPAGSPDRGSVRKTIFLKGFEKKKKLEL